MRLFYTILYYSILFLNIETAIRQRIRQRGGSDAGSGGIYTILYYSILFNTIQYYSILFNTILYYSILFYTILYYSILFYTILYYSILAADPAAGGAADPLDSRTASG